MAVGLYSPASDPADDQTLVESYNGSSWSIVPSPDNDQENDLSAVSCTTVSSCVAVGFYFIGGQQQTLVESWDGSAWTVVPSENEAGDSNVLTGVSCASPTACLAVGEYYVGTVAYTLAESWNGSTWSIVPTVNPGGGGNQLNGVSCTTSMYCVAVGREFPNASDETETLVETWDGSQFDLTASPNPSTEFIDVNGVSCTSSTSCTAVGSYFNGTIAATLVETWDGSSWTVTPSPNPANDQNGLFAVSCTDSTTCTAVGSIETINPRSSVRRQNLIETWDGTSWSVAVARNEAAHFKEGLSGVTCTVLTACVAVGSYQGDSTYLTLIQSSLAITTTALPNGTLSQPYSAMLEAAGGNPPYTWTMERPSRLPRGLKLDKTTGVISGTPRAAGSFTIAVEAECGPGQRGETAMLLPLTIT